MAIGIWGHRWVQSAPSLDNLDPSLLMWDMRRNLQIKPLPERKLVIQYIFAELSEHERNWWLLIDPTDGVDLCLVDPGFDVDLYASVDLRTMTAIWMALESAAKACATHRLSLMGDQAIAQSMQDCLGLSPFAQQKKGRVTSPFAFLGSA